MTRVQVQKKISHIIGEDATVEIATVYETPLKFDPFSLLTKIRLGLNLRVHHRLVVLECKREEKDNLFLSIEKNQNGIIMHYDDGDERDISTKYRPKITGANLLF